MPDLTEVTLLETMHSIATPISIRPRYAVISPAQAGWFRLVDIASTEIWDRRRLKREMRRPLTSTYHRANKAGTNK